MCPIRGAAGDRALGLRLARILRWGLDPLLCPLGFRRRGLVSRRPRQGLAWLIEVLLLESDHPGRLAFTLACGVHVPGRTAAFGYPLRAAPIVGECSIWARIGLLPGDGPRQGWELGPADDRLMADAELALDLRAWVVRLALPFLHRFDGLGDVVAYLETPRAPAEAGVWPRRPDLVLAELGVLAALLHRPARCVAALRQAEAAAEYPEVRAAYRALRLRLGGPLTDRPL